MSKEVGTQVTFRAFAASNHENRQTGAKNRKMKETRTKILKLALVCLVCIGLVSGLVYLIQFLSP